METENKILVVDDEDDVCKFLKDYLEAHGYSTFTANDGDGMRKVMDSEDIDLVILDLVMPGEDGLTLTRSLRENSHVAIIILTGKDEEVDRIVGLEMGADDYVAKPFSSRKLLARVKTVLRRTAETAALAVNNAGSAKRFAGWKLDKVGRTLLSPKEVEVPLTTMEFNLLNAFADNPNKVLDRDRLLDMVQHRNWEPYDRSVDVLVGRLRNKIESNPKKPELIKTVRGAGYVFATNVDHE
ncbi:MAG: response regulator [Rhodospirillales bacterium]|nr:DNA-binding response regulator [Rhodospirillaceae bacterium]MDP6429657.1 response regulator [Rhodospirillales bacterium]MDP6644150.1 response regulator [Rhodospirillales bacterium]MDP6843023.1 response regulator [Rhodospirillales bacterium]